MMAAQPLLVEHLGLLHTDLLVDRDSFTCAFAAIFLWHDLVAQALKHGRLTLKPICHGFAQALISAVAFISKSSSFLAGGCQQAALCRQDLTWKRLACYDELQIDELLVTRRPNFGGELATGVIRIVAVVVDIADLIADGDGVADELRVALVFLVVVDVGSRADKVIVPLRVRHVRLQVHVLRLLAIHARHLGLVVSSVLIILFLLVIPVSTRIVLVAAMALSPLHCVFLLLVGGGGLWSVLESDCMRV